MALRISGGAHGGHSFDFRGSLLILMETYKKVCLNSPCKVKNPPGFFKVGGKWTSHFTQNDGFDVLSM